MSWWMEIWAALNSSPPSPIEAIVPTVVFPFVLLGAILSSLLTAIAGLFGVDWHAETPKKLLTWLLRPRVLLSMLALNFLVFGGIYIYQNFAHRSLPLWWITYKNSPSVPSTRAYSDTWNVQSRAFTSSTPTTIPASNLANPTDPSIAQVWRTTIQAGSFRGATISGESIFTGADDGYVYELDRTSGVEIRKFYVGRAVTPLPMIWRQTLFVGEGVHKTNHARVYAFDLRTGELKGSVQTLGHTEGDIVLGHDGERPLVFAAAGADGLYAIDAETLEVVWQAPIAHIDSGVLVSGDVVFAATGVEKGKDTHLPALQALSIRTGETIWKVELAASGWSRPIEVGDKICIGIGEVYGTRNYGQFACYSRTDGSALVAMNFGAPLFNTPIVVPDQNRQLVLVADFSGNVCLLDVALAKREWCTKVDVKKNLYASPAILNQTVLVPAENSLNVIDLKSGQRLKDWTPEGGDPIGPFYAGATVSPDGVYLIDQTGRFVKVRTTN